jgi:protein TonB
MRRDLIIGILVSVLIHGGLGWGGQLFSGKKKETKKEAPPTVELVEMPKVEPDEPDPTDTSDAPPDPTVVAPPSMVDVPGVVQIDSFVQQVQPPPPPSLGRPTGALTIPTQHVGSGVGKGLGNIFDLKNLDQVPVAKFQAKPVYPFEMRRAGITGEVTVGFVVDSNGDVQQAYVINSTQREFEAAAVQAVSKWKFRPGRKGGKAVNTRMLQPISFSLSAED